MCVICLPDEVLVSRRSKRRRPIARLLEFLTLSVFHSISHYILYFFRLCHMAPFQPTTSLLHLVSFNAHMPSSFSNTDVVRIDCVH